MFCINVRAHVFACTSVVPHECVCVCACGFGTSIHTCHMPHTTGDSLYHVIPVTIVLCSLCLPSSQIINRFTYTTQLILHTFYMNCRYPLPYPSYQQDSLQDSAGSSSHSLAHSHTRTLVHTPRPCAWICVYMYLST